MAGLSVWYSLPDNLRNHAVGMVSFRHFLEVFKKFISPIPTAKHKTHNTQRSVAVFMQRIRGFTTIHYTNLLFNYLTAYLLSLIY